MLYLSNFQIIRPRYETDQAVTLDWLAELHTRADPSLSKEQIQSEILRVGCKPDRIQKRGHVIPDYLHRNWDDMEIYNLKSAPYGEPLLERSLYFEQAADTVFEGYYPEGAQAPDDLIHVSCTGYVSPSGAQKIASKRGWHDQTTVTHAYHMGCYASMPALRMAGGFLAFDPSKQRADIVHTEICSLHVNPLDHRADRLVSQTLFADGFIKYTAKRSSQGAELKVLAILDEIIASSIEAMSWKVAHFGFEMTLLKEIPVLIKRALPSFLKKLAEKAGLDSESLIRTALFAIHPGGPKIVDQIQSVLGLSDEQIRYSVDILKCYGNMSSATLPHIWERILSSQEVPPKTLVVSLAFGPGLSITGCILEVLCGG
jgi:predicted naringenin-chalcone synthase